MYSYLYSALLIMNLLIPSSIQQTCSTNSDCFSIYKPYCQNGNCNFCTAAPSTGCAGNTRGSICSLECEPTCTTSADCPNKSGPQCFNGGCALCVTDSDCSKFGSGYTCFQDSCTTTCSTGSDCTDVTLGSCSGGYCSFCQADSECSHFTQTPYCTSYTCVQCRTTADCSPGFLCTKGACTCTSNSACTSPTASRCDPSGQCKGCATDSDCSQISGLNVCSANQCVAPTTPTTPTTPTPTTTPTTAQAKKSLAPGWIVFAVIGSCVGALSLVILIRLSLRKKRKDSSSQQKTTLPPQLSVKQNAIIHTEIDPIQDQEVAKEAKPVSADSC